MTPIQALILSVVEGITEFLPVSSTGHLTLVSTLMGLPQTDFQKSFDIIIQLGAILAVAVLYFNTILRKPQLIRPILLAFFPTVLAGFIFYKPIKEYLIGNSTVTVLSLFFGGLVLLFTEKIQKGSKAIEAMGPKDSLIIGSSQILSFVPGISRSAVTIISGMATGLTRKDAVEFSFLLSVPTMIAASGLDMVKNFQLFSGSDLYLLAIGFIGAFVSALVAVRTFIGYIKTHSLALFGWYRILIALLFFFTQTY